MDKTRRYDQMDVLQAVNPRGDFFVLPDDMEKVLRTFTPEAHDSEVLIDVHTGTFHYLDRYGRRKQIPRTDVRAVLMESMNLPGHGPIFGDL